MKRTVIAPIVGCAVVMMLAAPNAQTSGTGQASPPKPATEQKPAAKPESNRPKPENQPGAVKNAEDLAASHAGHHEMHKLEGGGVLPPGWHHRFDLPDMKLEDMRFSNEGTSRHVTSGPPGIYYDPNVTATGAYTVKAKFTQLSKGEHREGYGPFIGGTALDGDAQHYVYFLLRQDGQYLIKERVGTNTRGITDWTPHAAIKPFGADGHMTNELAIVVAADAVRFMINGTEVARKARTEVQTDGIVGLRINHQLDLLVDGPSVER